MWRNLISAGLAGLLVIMAARLGIAERLGAHPFWAVKTGYIGALAGVVAGLALSWVPAGRALIVGALVAGIGLLAAKLGAARFAASYAEDAIAGRFWFFGWIVAAAGATLIVHSAVRAGLGVLR
ncbi:MAG: hypothetical protein B7Z02_06350 [Rhodobacterales bacterium 32-67-9]|nr:MAG: hypothetical protein B7Z02_06350 [Rhodobacterales bacterium 32-67-9]